MEKDRVLVVEDDNYIAQMLRYTLEREDFEVEYAGTGEEAMNKIRERSPDMVILDLLLPGIDGLTVCRLIKTDSRTAHIPVIVLTCKKSEADRVMGFEVGADDYVTKPFSIKEFLLRIKTILKRVKGDRAARDVVEAGPIKVDQQKYAVYVSGKQVHLSPMEFALLYKLTQKKGEVVTRAVLLRDIWGRDDDSDTRTLDIHVKRLRLKLGRASSLISTVRGIGYMLKG